MEHFHVFLALLSTTVWSLIPSSQSDFDLPTINKHLRQLEEKLLNMESKSVSQDQKYSAVLTSVLSKLTKTTGELRDVRKELSDLKLDYNAVKTELASVKNQTFQNSEAITNMFVSASVNTSIMSREMLALKSEMNASEENVLDTISLLKSNIRVSETKLLSEIETLKLEMNLSKADADILHSVSLNVTETQTKLNILSASVSAGQRRTETEVGQLKHEIFKVNVTSQSLVGISEKMNLLFREVAFDAVQTQENNTVHKGFAVKFDTVRYDSSNSFVAHTGRFRVLVDGTYMFWVNAVVTDKSCLSPVYIQTTNGRIGSVDYSSNHTIGFGGTFGITVAFLHKGVKVWLNTSCETNMGRFSQFGGVLLTPKRI